MTDEEQKRFLKRRWEVWMVTEGQFKTLYEGIAGTTGIARRLINARIRRAREIRRLLLCAQTLDDVERAGVMWDGWRRRVGL